MNPETDLTTLAAVKAWLPVKTEITTGDDVITSLIKACSADFLRATKRPDLLAADYTEVHQGDGAARMAVYHWPINTITTLTVGGVSIPASTDKIVPGYFIDLDIDPERAFNLYLIGQVFTDAAPVKIVYNAGYTAIPYDVGQAVIDWIDYRYKGKPNTSTTQRRSTEGESVGVEIVDAPPNVLQVIERYKRCIPSVSRRMDENEARMARATAKGKRY
jgi:hypothetical protein